MLSNPASYAEVFRVGLVRIAELGRAWLQAHADGLPTHAIEQSIQDIWFGMEEAARSADPIEQQDIIAYQIETYGLVMVGLDPLLHPNLPVIPTTGATVRPRAFAINGRIISINGKGGYAGAVLSPN